MTAALELSPTPTSSTKRIQHDVAAHVSVALLALWWIGPMTARSGGRGPGATTVALVLAGIALLATRAHTRTGPWVWAAALALPLGALVVCLASPTGWYSSDDLASYAAASATALSVAAYATTPRRRVLVVIAVAAAGSVQFLEGFNAWWGGGTDPSRAMVGTFYSWNPFAAFLLPGALLAIGLAARGGRRSRLLGFVAAPLCAAGVAHSSSRATLALLVAGTIGSALLMLDAEGRARAVRRWLTVVALSALVTVFVAGPPLFDHFGSVTAAADAKADTGQGVGTNAGYRLDFWHRAVANLEHHTWVGTGSHALVPASVPHVSPALAASNEAHNGVLQALSDGGIALGVPVVLVFLALAVQALRLLVASFRSPVERATRLTLALALGAVLVHSFVDLDWTFPSSMLLTAVLGGLALALLPPRRTSVPRALPAALIALVCLAGVANWRWDDTPSDIAHVTGTPAQVAHELRTVGDAPLRDYRWARGVLLLAGGDSGPVRDQGVAHDDIRWALGAAADEASVDGSTQVFRARALLVLGQKAEATALLDRLLGPLGVAQRQSASDSAAMVYASAGEPGEARRLLVPYLGDDTPVARRAVHLRTLLQIDLQITGKPADSVDRCAYALVPSAERLPGTPDPGPPPAGAPCTDVLRGALA